MKEILKSPFFLLIIVSTGIIYLIIIYTLSARYRKFSLFLEQLFAGIFVFGISGANGVTVFPFTKLHPANLANLKTTPMTINLQLGIYALFLFLLIPRLSKNLRDLPKIVVSVLISDPSFCLLVLLICLSPFWSDTPEYTLKSVIGILEVTIVGIYIGKQYNWTVLFSFIRWISFFMITYSFVKPNALNGGLWSGILGHKNPFSFFMAQSSALWLLEIVYNKKKRYFSIIVFMLALVGVQKGGSGAGKVLVIVLLSLWGYLGFVKKLSVRLAFVSVVFFMVASICISILVLNNLESIIVDGLNKDMTLTGRTDFWPQVIDHINKRPFLGYGVGGFWQPWRGLENPAGDIIVAKSMFVPPHAHNGFLNLATELGWVGLSLYVVSFFNCIGKGVIYLTRSDMPEAALPLLIMVYTLMTNLTETGMFGISSYWFWYVVIVVRLSLDTQGENPK